MKKPLLKTGWVVTKGRPTKVTYTKDSSRIVHIVSPRALKDEIRFHDFASRAACLRWMVKVARATIQRIEEDLVHDRRRHNAQMMHLAYLKEELKRARG